jgi:hypothetical protein
MNVDLSEHAAIASYQIFACQELNGRLPTSHSWKKIGDVNALPLPMTCTLSHFTPGNKYYFTVRAEDAHRRVGLFSDPQSIALT